MNHGRTRPRLLASAYDSPIGTLLRPLPKYVSLPSCYSQGLAHDGEDEYTFSITPSNNLFPACDSSLSKTLFSLSAPMHSPTGPLPPGAPSLRQAPLAQTIHGHPPPSCPCTSSTANRWLDSICTHIQSFVFISKNSGPPHLLLGLLPQPEKYF